MISGLLVLNSSNSGVRDLYWNDDPDTKAVGYNIYRAHDYPRGWVKLNEGSIPGRLWRDMTKLELVDRYVVQDNDWVERGEFGRYGFKVPERIVYSDVVTGRATLAMHPMDVTLLIDGQYVPAAAVEGHLGTIWLLHTDVMQRDHGVKELRLGPDLKTATKVEVSYYKLVNFVDIYQNLTRTFYTVVSVDSMGNELQKPGDPGVPYIDTMQVDAMDYMQAEMVRRNAWLFEQVGEPAHLFLRRTKGVGCACVDPNQQTPRTGCTSCYETGTVGGYYGPLDFLYLDPDTAISRSSEEGGVKTERSSKSMLGPSPIVQDGDLIVRKNGERLVIHNVTYKSPRGVLLQQEFDVQLLKGGDTRYILPIGNGPFTPKIYNPAFEDFIDGSEPVSNPETDPTKIWENPTKPQGRTTTFGRIQT